MNDLPVLMIVNYKLIDNELENYASEIISIF